MTGSPTPVTYDSTKTLVGPVHIFKAPVGTADPVSLLAQAMGTLPAEDGWISCGRQGAAFSYHEQSTVVEIPNHASLGTQPSYKSKIQEWVETAFGDFTLETLAFAAGNTNTPGVADEDGNRYLASSDRYQANLLPTTAIAAIGRLVDGTKALIVLRNGQIKPDVNLQVDGAAPSDLGVRIDALDVIPGTDAVAFYDHVAA